MNRLSATLLIIFIPLTTVLSYLAFFDSSSPTEELESYPTYCEETCRQEAFAITASEMLKSYSSFEELASANNEKLLAYGHTIKLDESSRFKLNDQWRARLQELGELEPLQTPVNQIFYDGLSELLTNVDERTAAQNGIYPWRRKTLLCEDKVVGGTLCTWIATEKSKIKAAIFDERVRLTEEKLNSQQ